MKNKSLSIKLLYTWFLCFAFIPLLLIVVTSFLSKDAVHLVKLPFTLNNYAVLFTPLFMKIFIRSLLISTITTLVCLLLAYPFSYILIKSKIKTHLLLMIMIPFWTSSLVRTYALLSLLKGNGILNTLLIKIHFITNPLNLLYTNFAVISGLVYSLFPFMVLPIFNNMERFDFKIMEAARDLGAGPLDIFFRVFLPNTKKGIISGCILVFLPAMTLFYIPNILGGARSFMIGNLIQSEFLEMSDWPQGSATSIGLILIVLIFVYFVRFRGKKQ